MNSAAYCTQQGIIMAAWLALSAGSGIAGPQTGNLAQQWLIDSDAEEHYKRAVGLAKDRRTQAAEAEFRAAWERAPDQERYAYGLAMHYTHSHQFEKALSVIRDNVTRHGPTALGWTLEGELLFEQKQYGPAYECLQNALKLSLTNARAHELIGLILVVHRRNMEALEELRIAAQQNPESPQAHFYYGRICYTTADYATARDEFQACLQLQADYPEALENLGLAFEALNDDDKALECYRKAIALDKTATNPPSEEPYIELGRLLAKLDEDDEAISVLREGLQKHPNSARGNYEFGRVLFRTRHYADAEKLLVRSVELDPNFSRPHFLLAAIYRAQNRAREASSELARFQNLDKVPENRQARITGR
jgi:tetratricopeptide (TPR) repeat protein